MENFNEEKKELTQQQIIRQKIKELKELESIEKKISKLELDKQKLINKRKELEEKYGL
jgi:hypothetical protein